MNGFQKVIKICAICFAIYLIFNIVIWSLMGLGLFASIVGITEYTGNERAESYSQGELYKNEVFDESEYEDIERIKLDIAYLDAYIDLTDGRELTVNTDCQENSIKIENVDGTLRIKEEKDWFFSTKRLGKVQINIPRNMNLEKLDLDTGAGKVNINKIKAENLNIDHGAGKLEINDCDFQTTKIEAGAGEVKINNSTLNDLKLDSGVGRVEINGKITGNSKIECGIGEMDITLQGQEDDYKIIAEKGIGSLKINENSCGNETTHGNGTNRIKLEGGIGAINIKFNN